MVYVLAKNGTPLMPTMRHGKVRRMLKDKQAIIVRRSPFTIRLLYDSETVTQPITLGVDVGSKKVGLSATTADKELFSAEAELRNDVVENIAARRECRRNRRARKTRYREARFDNRRREDGWLAPSVRQKIHSHMRLVQLVCEILPISKIVIEVAQFDIQKINNPAITGTGYQQGEQMGFWNVREYVLYRDGHECRHCKGKSKDEVLNVHHIESRKTGGDAPNNLITLCNECHGKYHAGLLGDVRFNRGSSYRDAAFMGILRKAIYERLKADYPNVQLTYGYLTKSARIAQGIEKTHAGDARMISGNAAATPTGKVYSQKFVRTRNRQIHKRQIQKGGKRKMNQTPKYVYGYQLYDKVRYKGQELYVWGRRQRGSFLLRSIDGKIRIDGVSYKKIGLLESRKSLLMS